MRYALAGMKDSLVNQQKEEKWPNLILKMSSLAFAA